MGEFDNGDSGEMYCNSSACVTASSANRSYGSVGRSLPRVGSFRTILRGRGVWVEMGELHGYVFRDNVLGWEGDAGCRFNINTRYRPMGNLFFAWVVNDLLLLTRHNGS